MAASNKLPEFPYHKSIFELYIGDPHNQMWNKYTKLQLWLNEVNRYIIEQYRSEFKKSTEASSAKGETFYAMERGEPILQQYD